MDKCVIVNKWQPESCCPICCIVKNSDFVNVTMVALNFVMLEVSMPVLTDYQKFEFVLAVRTDTLDVNGTHLCRSPKESGSKHTDS